MFVWCFSRLFGGGCFLRFVWFLFFLAGRGKVTVFWLCVWKNGFGPVWLVLKIWLWANIHPVVTDDGGFSSKDKKSLGIALTSCGVAVIAIVIAIFTVLVCSRSKDKETDSESGLVPERNRREPDNLSRLFEARPRRQNMSALWRFDVWWLKHLVYNVRVFWLMKFIEKKNIKIQY